jgi:hypothetical protein
MEDKAKQQDQQQAEAAVYSMTEKWSKPLVPRSLIGEFTCGLLSSRYMANLDSLGEGPDGAMRCGGKVFYQTEHLARWLVARTSLSPKRTKGVRNGRED